MTTHSLVNGRYVVPLVDFGKRLQNNFGLTIKEHPAFGGITAKHAKNSYHYVPGGGAIDIQDWRPDVIDGVHWRTRTGNLQTALQGVGPEIIGPNSGDPDHASHLHLAATDGNLSLSPAQYDYFFGGNAGGKSSTFDLKLGDDGGGTPPTPVPDSLDEPNGGENDGVLASRSEAVERTQNWAEMSKSQLDAEYDKIRDTPDGAKTGLEMHKAYFGKP